jgi:lysophospholipase L1-like esterase
MGLVRGMGTLLVILWMALGGCGFGQTPRLTPLKEEAVILAFGDSLTFGTGAPAEQSYPAILENLTGHTVIRSGVPGEESGPGLKRLPEVLEEYQPDLLILCHGGNDFLRRRPTEQTTNNLRAMIQLARERGIEVMLIGVPAFGLFLSTAALYDELATELRVPLEGVALTGILRDPALKSDTIHPNAQGYHRLAEAVRNVLKTHGALP